MKKHQVICEDLPAGKSVTLLSAAESGFLQGAGAVKH